MMTSKNRLTNGPEFGPPKKQRNKLVTFSFSSRRTAYFRSLYALRLRCSRDRRRETMALVSVREDTKHKSLSAAAPAVAGAADPIFSPSSWWRPRITDASITEGVPANQLIGVFHRAVFEFDISAPTPIPTTDPSYWTGDEQPLRILPDGNKKEHMTVMGHDLRPIGFVIRFSQLQQPSPFAEELAKQEWHDRHCDGPRPVMSATPWMRAIKDQFRRVPTTLDSHWHDALGREKCIERPDLSFIFGQSHNPISPLLSRPSSMSAAAPSVARQPYFSDITPESAVQYLRMVVLQAWLAVHSRWAEPVSLRLGLPPFILMLSTNDCSGDLKPTGEGDLKCDTDWCLDHAAPIQPYSDDETIRQLETEDSVFHEARLFAMSAKCLTFGRFYNRVRNRLCSTATDKLHILLQAETQSNETVETFHKNVLNKMESADRRAAPGRRTQQSTRRRTATQRSGRPGHETHCEEDRSLASSVSHYR
jgi:hypothetical protein